MNPQRIGYLTAAGLVLTLGAWQIAGQTPGPPAPESQAPLGGQAPAPLATQAQTPRATLTQSPTSKDQADKTAQPEFQFDVTKVVDAKYLGDTPSLIGRGGNVVMRPGLALDDPVYRDKEEVGYITSVDWDRAKQSLEIEFSPRPMKKVAVGDRVWVRFKKNRD